MSVTDDSERSTATVGTDRWFLSSAPILRALIHLCVPMAAAEVVTSIYSVVNSGFIGSLHDTVLLAAITFAIPMFSVVLAVGGVFGIGGGAFISRLLGESEDDASKAAAIKNVSAFALWGSLTGGAVVSVGGLVLLHPLVDALGATATTQHATTTYVTVLLAFVPVLSASFCLEQLVRAEGASKQAMIGLIGSAVGNVGFDVLFILVLHRGVAGAALATGLTNVVSAGYFAAWLTRRSVHMSLSLRWFTLSPKTIGPVFGIGFSVLLQALFLIVTSLLLNHLAADYGNGPLAAMGVAVRVAQVPGFILMGVTTGVLPLLAFAYGRRDRQRLSDAMRTSAYTVTVIALTFSVPIFIFRHPLFSLFTSDQSVLTTGDRFLTAQLLGMIVTGFAGLITSMFQAAGRSRLATVISVTQGVAFIPIILLGKHWFGLNGVVWALPLSESLVLIVGITAWLTSRRSIDRALSNPNAQQHHRDEEVKI